MNSKLSKRYSLFFFRQNRFVNIFGVHMIAYAVTLVVLSLVCFVANEGLSELPTAPKVLIPFLIVLMHILSMASLLAGRLSASHNEYLRYLGFRNSDLRSLACIVAAPSNFAHALLIFALVTNMASLLLGIISSIVVLAVCELLAPALMIIGQRSGLKKKRDTQRSKSITVLAKAYSGPHRAFFTKDLLAFRVSDTVGMLSVLLIGILVMLPSNAFGSLSAYALCLYISMLLPVYESSIIVLSKETEPYHRLYKPLMHMKDRDFLTYKLLLQLFVVAGATILFSVFSFVLYEFSLSRVMVSVAAFLYFSLFSYSIDWIHLKRIRERKAFDSLYELSLMPLVAIPGLATIIALASHVYRILSKRGSKVC